MADPANIPVESSAVVPGPKVSAAPVLVPRPPAPSRRRRRPLLVALALMVAGGLGAAAVLARSDEGPDPGAVLSAAQDALGDAHSFAFTVIGESHLELGSASSEAGTAATIRFTGAGEWADGRWRTHVDYDGIAAIETLFDGTTTYDRVADSAASLDDATWTSYPEAGISREEMIEEIRSIREDLSSGPGEVEGIYNSIAVNLATQVYLGPEDDIVSFENNTVDGAPVGGFFSDPTGFVDSIRRLGEPSLVDDTDGMTTLATTVAAPDDIVEAFGRPIPDGHVELDVSSRDDLPQALRLDVRQADASAAIEVVFIGWGAPHDIVVPPDDEVTPAGEDVDDVIEEFRFVEMPAPEDLRTAAGEVTFVWPTGLEDMALVAAVVMSPEELLDTDEPIIGACTTVMLGWDSDAGDYLHLSLRAARCALTEDPTPFEPGGPGGWPSRPSPFLDDTLEVQVGNTAAIVDTSLTGATLDAVLSNLSPVDVETVIAATEG